MVAKLSLYSPRCLGRGAGANLFAVYTFPSGFLACDRMRGAVLRCTGGHPREGMGPMDAYTVIAVCALMTFVVVLYDHLR